MAARERPAWASALRELRQRHSLSQEDLAAKVNVDRTTVSRWETGRNRPQPQQLQRICSEFAVSLRDVGFVESDSKDEMERRQVVKGLVGIGLVGAVGSPALEGSSELSPVVPADRLTAAERSVLGEVIGRNIESAWALFHMTDTQRMMAVGRTQLYMLEQHRAQLDQSTLPAFYSAAYRLVGATYHRRGLYREALHVHERAYLTALEAGDAWNMAETRAWQAYGMQALGRYEQSLQVTEAALRLLAERSDLDATRLKARLLTAAAMNAATLRDEKRVSSMLYDSELLLDKLPGQHEEFDKAAWLESAGVCALRLGQLDQAVKCLQQAFEEVSADWIARCVFTIIALSRALVWTREWDAALATSQTAIPLLTVIRSRELTEHYVGFLRADLMRNFPDDRRCLAFVAETEPVLLAC